MPEPIIIKLDYSPRGERRAKQVKGAASRLGRAIASRSIDRPNIGKNRRKLGSGRIDIPTGGVRGSKKPTGNRLDLDNDGWSDEGTTNPVWVGLSSGRERPSIRLGGQKKRPTIKLNNRASSDRENLRKKQKYGNKVGNDGVASRKNGPKWLSEFSNQQIADLLVPDSFETYASMLADSYGIDVQQIKQYIGTRVDIAKPWLKLDYSEKSTKELKRLIKNSLDESPVFSWAVRNYGSPIYAVLTRESAKSYNDRPNVKPLYEKLKQLHPDAPGEPEFSASTHLDLDLVTLNPSAVLDKKSWQTKDPVSETFSTSKIPSASETVIDRSIPGTLVHEWAHWYHSGILLSNIESSENRLRTPKSLINPKDSDFAQKVKIAMEYNTDDGNMNLHANKVPFQDSPNEPRTITSYGHVSKKEIFAEGVLAYMHPNEKMKSEAINQKLKTDIENILAGDDGVAAWKDSKAQIRKQKNILSSGRKNRKLTKLSSGSKTEKPKKPTYPRHPSYGPFLDGADDVFADVKNWKDFKEVYDNLEINFFDYETTGLVSDEFRQSSGNGAPVQFGVTKTKGGKEIGRLNIFMNPGEELSDWSRKNLKNKDGESLTDEWLSSQTSIADAHKKLIEFVGPDAIFGVQNAVFDKTVLEDALTSSGIDWRPKGWVDTKVVSDLVIPKWTKENQDAPWTTDEETGEKIPSSSLKALTEYLNIDLGKKHHTADADAAATSELMSKIIDKAIEKNWSNDIFNKEWRDQKIANKLENYQQKIIDFEQEKNNWISKTSPKKSTVPKDADNKEFGFGRLSSGTTSYKGRHESPDASSGAPLHNLANGAIYPEDIYGPNGANLYGGAFPDLAQKAVAVFRKLRNKPDSELTVYRAVPKGKDIKEGDWVTILPEYAKIHGDSWLKDDYEIATKKVKAKELFNEGNSLLEFGYHSKLSSGKNDGAPTYKGKVWKDRKSELDGPVYSFRSQAEQYPEDGPPGISYFKGVVDDSTWVDCLLFRDDSGKVIGILNYYPFALVDPDDPRIVEKRGNINIFIDPKHKGKGIGTKLVDEAVSRYNVDLRKQRYSEEGSQFINKYVRKLPENVGKQKLSSGATEITPAERKEIADKQLSVKLSALDIEAIGNWNGYLFKDINDYLRNNNSGNQELAEGVVQAFERISVPVPANLVLWRGIRASQAEAKAYRVGDTLQDDGFQSATFKKRIATQFNSPRSINDEWGAVVFEINTKKGTKVVDIQSLVEKLDLASDAEDEILLQNGTQYKVTKIERNINQNEWAGIDDTSFKGEKITVITVDIIKNSDKGLRLSSGSQPRMNLSDEEKREIIAIASQRTDDFSKSVVAQFRRNGKLSDRQWNALNKMTLGRSRLSSGREILPDAIKLTKAEQKILKEVGESGTPDFAKVVHAVALDYDEPGSILDNMKPTNMRVTWKNARTVSSEIQRQAQESLERAGFPEEFSVWRTANPNVALQNRGVVSVTTRKGGLGSFKGTVVEYRVSRSDVLTHGEGFLGNRQTFGEDELHVDTKKLRRAELSSGSVELSEMSKQRIQRRIDSYEAAVKKGDGSESRLRWDGNGKLKERPIIVSEVDDDYDDDEELSKEEKENNRAYTEFSKISLEEMAERTRRAEESKRKLNSPEYLEQSRLRRVARNKGKETNTYNADGTIKIKDEEKLSSGKTNRAKRRANNSKLSSGKSPVLNDEEKKQISDILKKEFPEGISSAVGKMADYSGSRLQNNRDGQVSLNPQEKKAIEALESVGRIIDKRISEEVSKRESAGDSKKSPETQLLLEEEKVLMAARIYLYKVYSSTEKAQDEVKKLGKQVRKSMISSIYKIPKKTAHIDKEYSEHNNKISGSYLVELVKSVMENLTAGEYRAAENYTPPVYQVFDPNGRAIGPRQIINFENIATSYSIRYSRDLHLTDLVSEIDMAFLTQPEKQPIINDITFILNFADQISERLIRKTAKEGRKISELSDAEILDFLEKELYSEGEWMQGSASGKYRVNNLTGKAFEVGPDVTMKELPERDNESSLRALNEKSAKDLLVKILRETFADKDVIQAFDKSSKAKKGIPVKIDEKLAEGVDPKYIVPSNLPYEEARKVYAEKRELYQSAEAEHQEQRKSYVEQGLILNVKGEIKDQVERQTAELKRELFVQALEELGVVFTKPENVRKTVVRLYMQRLDRFYQWVKGLGLREGRDGKNRPDETIDFSNDNPYEYRRQVGGEAEQRHATTYLLMDKVLSLIPENLTNGSLIVELPVEEAERLKNLSASETFGYLGKHKIISKYFADAWVNPLEKGGSKLSIIWRLVPGKERAHAHNVLNGKVLITQEPAPTDGPTDAWESVALHEITHGVEYANPVVTALEWMYWVSRRKANEALTTLRHKNGIEYRDKDEKGVVDEWGESYAGKIYDGRPFDALEILTTGMQSLFYENTSKNVDPSHRAFTIGILVAAGSGKPQ